MDSLSSSRSGSSTSSPDSLRSSSPSSSQLSSSSLYYRRSNSERLHLKGRQRSQSGRLSMSPSSLKSLSKESLALSKAQSRSARRLNDSLVYLDGPQIYTCGQCRTHLTSHDEIISKSFHGRHGRAYLFDHCVNVSIGPAEDRLLITGLHSVCDIFCKRCKTLVGWTYAKAYEASQKYKEGKFIIEKINLHLEESDYYDVAIPPGERMDRFRARSISWGSEGCSQTRHATVYEYHPSRSSPTAMSM